jgi:hypothetical protein
MGFISSLADPNVWYWAAAKPDGFQYYKYILECVDDLLVLSHVPVAIMKGLEEFYCL